MTLAELKQLARDLDIPGRSGLTTKAALEGAILARGVNIDAHFNLTETPSVEESPAAVVSEPVPHFDDEPVEIDPYTGRTRSELENIRRTFNAAYQRAAKLKRQRQRKARRNNRKR